MPVRLDSKAVVSAKKGRTAGCLITPRSEGNLAMARDIRLPSKTHKFSGWYLLLDDTTSLPGLVSASFKVRSSVSQTNKISVEMLKDATQNLVLETR